MQGMTIRECAFCHEHKEIAARGLCHACYGALKKRGELFEFSKINAPEEELPVREPWTYSPPDEIEALQAISERLEAQKVESLQQMMMLSPRLTVSEKKQILAMSSTKDIEKFVATLPADKSVTPEEARIAKLIQQLNSH